MGGKDRSDPLRRYRAKRSAGGTPEPMGAPTAKVPEALPRFVVQQHAATRMHWDLRLEIAGVLRSWAVPRGPSSDPDEKRLAVETEDHPVEYLDFEGVIPEGNYGAGSMIVWDRGTLVPHLPLAESLEDGKLLFELRGHKLRGVWTLFRTGRGESKEWLLVKKPDGFALGRPFSEVSILSGLRVDELTERAARADALLERVRAAGATARSPGAEFAPMLAERRNEPFDDPAWVFEPKYDGFRLIARGGAPVRLCYRSGRDATHLYPELVRTLAASPHPDLVLDGEVVVADEHGLPDFQRLQRRALLSHPREIELASRRDPATLWVFDLLACGPFDLRPLALETRKDLLRAVVPEAGPLRYSEHVRGRGRDVFKAAVDIGLEGAVGKRADSRYVGGRSPLWQKIRKVHTDDFVICGYTLPEGGRLGLGSLHLCREEDGALHYCGGVGTGFTDRDLLALRERLEPLHRSTPAFVGEVPPGRGNVWVEPRLWCEVKFLEITEDGAVRQGVFLRMRDDRSAPGEEPEPPAPAPSTPTRVERKVVVTNPDKPFWPEDGLRKIDLVAYYEAIAPWLLPYLRDRPLVLTRYPDGIHGKSFFQKNAPPSVPSWIRTVTMWSEDTQREIDYFVCDDVESLKFVANLAAIPLHVWGSCVSALQRPDWSILDLDPKGAPFRHVVAVALAIRGLCDEIGLPNFVKTSGSTGLHVMVPLGRTCTFEQCRQLAQVLARVIADRMPDVATVERVVSDRGGRVYIDFLQNGHGRLLVAPYSVRPLPGAPVSAPLRWDEVDSELRLSDFTMATMPARAATLADDPLRGVLGPAPDLTAVLARLAAQL